VKVVALSNKLTAHLIQVRLAEVNNPQSMHKMFKDSKTTGFGNFYFELGLSEVQDILNVVSHNYIHSYCGCFLFQM